MPSKMKDYIDRLVQKQRAEDIPTLTLDNVRATHVEGFEGHKFPILNHLSFISCGLESLDGLTDLPSVRILDLSENKITDLSIVPEKCPALYHLNLCGNPITSVETLKPLAKTNIRVLDVFDCPISEVEDYRKQIFSTIPSLKYLDGFDEDDEQLDSFDCGDEDGFEDVEFNPEDDEEEEENGPGLEYLESSDVNKDDEDDADYEETVTSTAGKSNGLKRGHGDSGDSAPSRKAARQNGDEEN